MVLKAFFFFLIKPQVHMASSFPEEDPSSCAVWWLGCVTSLSLGPVELMAQLSWPYQLVSSSLERHLTGGKRECNSPAYFHLGSRYSKTKTASWSKAENSASLGTGPRPATTRQQSLLPAHHQDKVEPHGHGWTQTRVLQVKGYGIWNWHTHKVPCSYHPPNQWTCLDPSFSQSTPPPV